MAPQLSHLKTVIFDKSKGAPLENTIVFGSFLFYSLLTIGLSTPSFFLPPEASAATSSCNSSLISGVGAEFRNGFIRTSKPDFFKDVSDPSLNLQKKTEPSSLNQNLKRVAPNIKMITNANGDTFYSVQKSSSTPWYSDQKTNNFDPQGDPRSGMFFIGSVTSDALGFALNGEHQIILPTPVTLNSRIFQLNRELLNDGKEPIPLQFHLSRRQTLDEYLEQFLEFKIPVSDPTVNPITGLHDYSFHISALQIPPEILHYAKREVQVFQSFKLIAAHQWASGSLEKALVDSEIRALSLSLVRGIDGLLGTGNNSLSSQLTNSNPEWFPTPRSPLLLLEQLSNFLLLPWQHLEEAPYYSPEQVFLSRLNFRRIQKKQDSPGQPIALSPIFDDLLSIAYEVALKSEMTSLIDDHHIPLNRIGFDSPLSILKSYRQRQQDIESAAKKILLQQQRQNPIQKRVQTSVQNGNEF